MATSFLLIALCVCARTRVFFSQKAGSSLTTEHSRVVTSELLKALWSAGQRSLSICQTRGMRVLHTREAPAQVPLENAPPAGATPCWWREQFLGQQVGRFVESCCPGSREQNVP